MGDSLVVYIERLEFLAFFAGYPLVYSIVNLMASARRGQPGTFSNRMIKLLPFAYAFTATLFLGLVLQEFATVVSDKNIQQSFHISYLKIWGIGAVLFWIPLLGKKPVYSLAHSLVFFFILLEDILMGMSSVSGRDIVKNDMKIYTASFLLNTISLCVIIIFYYLGTKITQSPKKNTRL
jgi:hypothetical protein